LRFHSRESSARARPEWLSIFHYVSECVCCNVKDAVRLPLRSQYYHHDDASDFKARHLSWDYVESIAEDVRIAHEPPSVVVEVKSSAQDMAIVLQRARFVASLIEQLLTYSTWPAQEVKVVANKDVANDDCPKTSRSKDSLEVIIKRTFASALVLLHRCGFVSYNSLCKESLWKEVKDTCQKKLSAMGDSYEMNRVSHEAELSLKSGTNRPKDKRAAGSFEYDSLQVTREARFSRLSGDQEILDEYPERNELVDGLPSRKFYSAVFKEHKVLSEHVPDNIHVHAFANRLNVLHVLIIGPVGTPFDTTPFFFKFKLPADYPQKPPEVTYVAYSQEQLNPNLYQNGKVCTTLILVPEPYFNEAGYESRKQQSEMSDRSRRYNETAAINSLEYLLK
ncbi:ubiquitin--protein ligase, partial [Ostertagia ostertagi]